MKNLSKQQTAGRLNTTRRQINRFISYGFLVEKDAKVTLASINQYSYAIENLSKYSQKFIQEAYVFNVMGIFPDAIIGINTLNLNEINSLIQHYEVKRKQILRTQGLSNNFQEYFTMKETLARLNRKDPRIVSSLINENCLRSISLNSKKVNLIEASSFKKLINPFRQEHFFSTTEAAQQIQRGISIPEIDKICKAYSIGFKLRGATNENYFLTQNHIKGLEKIFLINKSSG